MWLVDKAWRGAALERTQEIPQYLSRCVDHRKTRYPGGSRERFDACLVYRYIARRKIPERYDEQNRALKRFLEPPAFARFGRTRVASKFARGRRARAKAAPLQARIRDVPIHPFAVSRARSFSWQFASKA